MYQIAGKNLVLLTLLILFGVGFFRIPFVFASELLSPMVGAYQVGEFFEVDILVKTGGNNIDTIRANLSFPQEILEVQEVLAGSKFSVMAGGNEYYNSIGRISWGAGALGGTDEDVIFATVVFKALTPARAVVSFTPGTLVLSAGLDLPFSTTNGIYELTDAAPEPTLTSFEIVPVASAPTTTNDISLAPETLETSSVFSGSSNVSEAIISFNIDQGLYTEEIKADEQGVWQWSVPDNFVPGLYSVSITTIDPDDLSNRTTEEIQFELTIKPEVEAEVLFSLTTDIPRKFKNVRAGESVVVDFKLESMEEVGPDYESEVIFDYTISDSGGMVVIREQETRLIRGGVLEFTKTFDLSEETKAGKYVLDASATYNVNDVVNTEISFRVGIWNWKYTLAVVLIIALMSAFVVWKRKRN